VLSSSSKLHKVLCYKGASIAGEAQIGVESLVAKQEELQDNTKGYTLLGGERRPIISDFHMSIKPSFSQLSLFHTFYGDHIHP